MNRQDFDKLSEDERLDIEMYFVALTNEEWDGQSTSEQMFFMKVHKKIKESSLYKGYLDHINELATVNEIFPPESKERFNRNYSKLEKACVTH